MNKTLNFSGLYYDYQLSNSQLSLVTSFNVKTTVLSGEPCLVSNGNNIGSRESPTMKACQILKRANDLGLYSLFQALCQWWTENASGRRVGSGREKGEIRRVCKHCFKNLIPVYQLLLYPLIGYF